MTSSMQISDLITAAGGMKESAFSLSAEISRTNLDSNRSDASANIKHILLESLFDEVL